MKTQHRYARAIGFCLVLAAPLWDVVAENANKEASSDSSKQHEAIEMRLLRRYRLIFIVETSDHLRNGNEAKRPLYAEVIRSNVFMYWFVTYKSKVLPVDMVLEKAINTKLIEAVAQYTPWEDPVPWVETETKEDVGPIIVDNAGIFLGVDERFFADRTYHDAVEKQFYEWIREKAKI